MRRGIVILSLFLVSILVISGCVQMSRYQSKFERFDLVDFIIPMLERDGGGDRDGDDRDIGEEITCGGFTCYEDGDTFTDYCLDESAVPALCGECLSDDWCGPQYSDSTCQYGVECGYGGGTCNECYAPGQFDCGLFTCYDDGDNFTDSCIDVASGTCGECVNDAGCGEGNTCVINTQCDYGEGPCNECVESCPALGDFPGAGGFSCGGSLVAQDWVLTAAHCCFSINDPYNVLSGGQLSPTGMFNQVVIGTHDTSWVFTDPENLAPEGGFTAGQEVIGVDGVVMHPDYLPGIEIYDFCLVHLSEPAPARFKPIRINTDKRLETGEIGSGKIRSVGSGVTVPGAGEWIAAGGSGCPGWQGPQSSNYEFGFFAPTVQEIDIALRPDCGNWQEFYGWNPCPEGNEDCPRFCAGGCPGECASGAGGNWSDPEWGSDSCQNPCDGDCGGPNVVWVKKTTLTPAFENVPSQYIGETPQPCTSERPENDPTCEPVLVGVTGLMNYYCTCENFPNTDDIADLPHVFASVAHVSDWILNIIEDRNPPFSLLGECFDCGSYIDFVTEYIFQNTNAQYEPSEWWNDNLEMFCELNSNSPYQTESNFCKWYPPGSEYDSNFGNSTDDLGSCGCPTECCHTIDTNLISQNQPLPTWMRMMSLGGGYTYRSKFEDQRLTLGEEVSPACGEGLGPNGTNSEGSSTCKYPFYVLLGTGFPTPEGEPGVLPGDYCNADCSLYGMVECPWSYQDTVTGMDLCGPTWAGGVDCAPTLCDCMSNVYGGPPCEECQDKVTCWDGTCEATDEDCLLQCGPLFGNSQPLLWNQCIQATNVGQCLECSTTLLTYTGEENTQFPDECFWHEDTLYSPYSQTGVCTTCAENCDIYNYCTQPDAPGGGPGCTLAKYSCDNNGECFDAPGTTCCEWGCSMGMPGTERDIPSDDPSGYGHCNAGPPEDCNCNTQWDCWNGGNNMIHCDLQSDLPGVTNDWVGTCDESYGYIGVCRNYWANVPDEEDINITEHPLNPF